MYKSRTSVFFLILGSLLLHTAQAQPFRDEIQAFKKQDSLQAPPPGKILFTGSSSIRLWKGLAEYFPNHTIINRGFGGATLADMIRYQNDLFKPYLPRQIVIYCGENDFAASDTITVETVTTRFKQLFAYIRQLYPNTPVVYVSMKPSPSRTALLPKYLAANTAIKNFLAGKRRTKYVDVYHKMLSPNGTPMADIFLDDQLHMNAKGYAIWKNALEPILIKD